MLHTSLAVGGAGFEWSLCLATLLGDEFLRQAQNKVGASFVELLTVDFEVGKEMAGLLSVLARVPCQLPL